MGDVFQQKAGENSIKTQSHASELHVGILLIQVHGIPTVTSKREGVKIEQIWFTQATKKIVV